ncbi:MAG: WbqC family protein [Prevotella sp.]|jgi:hypothetical protein|nr:WbqC family protein [Prevotella sp.]
MNVLLSTTYFGSIQWYQKLYRADETWIEHCESFKKQTYRNRCIIATTQGLQILTVPVERDSSGFIKDIRISDHGNWRHLHWNALLSAYGESPFFEYYEDDLHPFFERRWTYLFDFNEEIRMKMCELLDLRPQVRYTETYVAEVSDPISDFREAINPKHPAPDPDFVPRRYYQVYEAKHGFQPNLSIVDLLFNMGPEAILYL